MEETRHEQLTFNSTKNYMLVVPADSMNMHDLTIQNALHNVRYVKFGITLLVAEILQSITFCSFRKKLNSIN